MLHEIKIRQALRTYYEMIASVWSILRFDSTSFAHIRSYRPISNTKDNFSYILLCAITIDLIVRKCYCAHKSPIECEKGENEKKEFVLAFQSIHRAADEKWRKKERMANNCFGWLFIVGTVSEIKCASTVVTDGYSNCQAIPSIIKIITLSSLGAESARARERSMPIQQSKK